ncbi:BA14K family protein [Bradyrhizobium sp. 159]|uniref:BA14K family protein n=1 Tax=unclassified Bradyrhizobium TaxID=2631580 RepID=UPI001FF89ED6|nr:MULTISPECIES: BA14K family protein [unclassified Bradyrhizobium]MCK1617561.1 BA14K family protein [Bradyrhizobium sp. 159]MCK1664863.1 BA14K family protein [Bradyrhizobium sp. 153]
MNSLKYLSAAAAMALVLPLASPSFAQSRAAVVGAGGAHVGGGGGGGGAHFGGGGARMGGGGAAFHGGGGNFGAGAAVRPSGGSFAAGTAMRPSGGSFAAGTVSRPAMSPSFSGSRSVATAGNWQGGSNWSGRHWHHRRGGFWPGFAAGAAIGGLGSYAYYGGGYGYYDDPYYYDSYYDEPTVAVVPDSGGDSYAYCAQRYKSYDPASGTYLGYDGQRHPCP